MACLCDALDPSHEPSFRAVLLRTSSSLALCAHLPEHEPIEHLTIWLDFDSDVISDQPIWSLG